MIDMVLNVLFCILRYYIIDPANLTQQVCMVIVSFISDLKVTVLLLIVIPLILYALFEEPNGRVLNLRLKGHAGPCSAVSTKLDC